MTAAGGSHLPAASLLASSRQRGAQEDFMRLITLLSSPKAPLPSRAVPHIPRAITQPWGRDATSPLLTLVAHVPTLVTDAYLI